MRRNIQFWKFYEFREIVKMFQWMLYNATVGWHEGHPGPLAAAAAAVAAVPCTTAVL